MTDCILISRYMAKEALCSMCRWEGTSNCDECEHPIDGLPAIDPVKHGKWIKNEDRCGWHCSECKEDNLYAYSWNCEKGEYEFQDRYCPSCGAQMERSEE